jgi:syntaxin 18
MAWYLNRRLAEASASQKDMQEERMKRQVHRTRTLGSGAARDALSLGIGGDAPPSDTASIADNSASESWFGAVPGNLASSFMASVRGGDTPSIIPSSLPTDESESDEELELSQSQILQFEAENATILREVQDTLQSVQQAETRLLEIASLQTELVTQLTRQSEITDQLYDDAVAATGAVDKGNVELREAKRRAKDSRLFILVFLIGASLSLLFLHYY